MVFSEVHTVMFSKGKRLASHSFPGTIFEEARLFTVFSIRKGMFAAHLHLEQYFYLWHILSFGIAVIGAAKTQEELGKSKLLILHFARERTTWV